MNPVGDRKVMSSLAMSILLVAMEAFANHDDASNPHRFWGSASTEPGHGIRVAKRWDSPAGRLAKEFPISKYRLFTLDLDQDGRDDSIVESKKEWQTCFIKSDFTIKNCEEMNLTVSDGFSYQYFANLDRSETLYLLDLSGDENTSDHSLKRFDKKTWKLKKTFYNPSAREFAEQGKKGHLLGLSLEYSQSSHENGRRDNKDPGSFR